MGLIGFLFVLCVGANASETAGINLLHSKTTKEAPKTVSSRNDILIRIKENNDRISKILEARSSIPLIWDGSRHIMSGQAWRGMLLNSVVSTNLESPLLVRPLNDSGLPQGSKLLCSGTTKHRRVFSYCERLVTPGKEIPVKVQILNPDGSAGLLGDYDDGKEDLVAGILVNNLAQGVLAGAQGRIQTPFGEMAGTTLKNEVLSGAISTASAAGDLMAQEMKSKEPVVTIDAGKEVIIYFMEGADVY